MSEFEGALFTLAGVLFGGGIGYFSALSVARIQGFNQAAAKFRAAFSGQLYKLDLGKEDVRKILGDAEYIIHQKARIEFEPYMSKGNINLLNEAWEKYYNYRNCVGQNIAPGSVDTRNKELPNAQEIIEGILIFASNK